MMVLIEQYDADEPLFNLLPAMALQPQQVVVVGDARIQRPKHQKPLRRTLELSGLNMPNEFRQIQSLYDVEEIMDALESVIQECPQENCVLDVTGDSDALLFAAGGFCKQHDIGAMLHRPGANQMVWLNREKRNTPIPFDLHMTPRQAIAMAGGGLQRNGHVSADSIDEKMEGIILQVFDIFRRFSAKWPAFVQYLQLACRADYQEGDGFRVPKRLACNGHTFQLNPSIMQTLERVGVAASFQKKRGAQRLPLLLGGRGRVAGIVPVCDDTPKRSV